MTKEKTRRNVTLRVVTIERLDKMRHQGQSYNGIITELIDFYLKQRNKPAG